MLACGREEGQVLKMEGREGEEIIETVMNVCTLYCVCAFANACVCVYICLHGVCLCTKA